MTIEDILYEAHTLGIREETIVEVRTIRTKNPHMQLTDVYEQAFLLVKTRNFSK